MIHIVTKITREFTSVSDDGTKYLLGLYIALRHKVALLSEKRNKTMLHKIAKCHQP